MQLYYPTRHIQLCIWQNFRVQQIESYKSWKIETEIANFPLLSWDFYMWQQYLICKFVTTCLPIHKTTRLDDGSRLYYPVMQEIKTLHSLTCWAKASRTHAAGLRHIALQLQLCKGAIVTLGSEAADVWCCGAIYAFSLFISTHREQLETNLWRS